jgi:indole-3-glycerol phosphate synthase
MNILDKIIEHKRTEVATAKTAVSMKELERSPAFNRKTLSLAESLQNKHKNGIIAEFKRKSPSKGVINADASVVAVTAAYADHGASGISILTDEHFFGGTPADIDAARFNNVPILRKDFIIEEYQVLEARAMGADVILLIAACLSPEQVRSLAAFAKSLHLEVLLELHEESELGHVTDDTHIIGINNRDLKTFEVDIDRSLRMAEKLPANKIKVAESGIDAIETIKRFREAGFQGFLIGEHFMKQEDPAYAFGQFAHTLNNEFLQMTK